ncbi:uncharacterized protein LOC107837522 [Poecilia formosa]|uniref:uncharacterized protein LOC107837522 n=1 Tax=Poecilia formosa TaxID=48698 RepID=UPI0007B81D22|nr:PREDICTED: uncharacterized protein LOC107837522 [Poecilia formosa]
MSRYEGLAVLTIDPNWSTFHPGESVTFICDMNEAQPKAKLTAGSTTIPVGGSVTLSCSVEPSAGWKYRWFRRTINTPEVQLTDEENRDINVKQGGIYRCVGVRGNTNFHSVVSDDVIITIRLTVSSSPVLLIVGLISGVLIILLLLLWRYRRSNDLFCFSSAVSHGADQTEGHVYSSLLHGTTSVYETVRPRGATANESRHHHPEEDSVYVNMRPGHKSSA